MAGNFKNRAYIEYKTRMEFEIAINISQTHNIALDLYNFKTPSSSFCVI